MQCVPAFTGGGDVYKADRLFRGAAAWSRYSRNSDGQLRVGVLHRAPGHGAHRRFGNGAVSSNELLGHAEYFDFGSIGVDHEPALENIRRARNFRQQRRNEASCTAFRSCDAQLLPRV